MSHTAYQKNIFGQSNTQQAIIQDQWSHLELMEPHLLLRRTEPKLNFVEKPLANKNNKGAGH